MYKCDALKLFSQYRLFQPVMKKIMQPSVLFIYLLLLSLLFKNKWIIITLLIIVIIIIDITTNIIIIVIIFLYFNIHEHLCYYHDLMEWNASY